MSIRHITSEGIKSLSDDLTPMVNALSRKREWLASVPVDRLLALLDNFSRRLLRDPRTAGLEGAMFLGAWLRAATSSRCWN